MHLDRTTLEHRLESLRASGQWPSAEIDRFGRALAAAADWALFRINPLRFAEAERFDAKTALDLFVHGVGIGLFDLVWCCVCVFCGAVEYTYDSIDKIPSRGFHCTRCATDIDSWLDERVEVGFTLNASVAALELDPFADFASYERYFNAPSVVHQPATAAFLAEVRHGEVLLGGHASADLVLELPPGASRRLISFDRHAQLLLIGDPAEHVEPGPIEIEVEILPGGFTCESLRVPAGPVRLRLHNRAPESTGIAAYDGDVQRFRHEVERCRASLGGVVSGQMLLCTESFRRLFRVQTLAAELALNVRYVALMFTDLVASTQLYERVGDAAAYQLVREHFRQLHQVTDAHGGAVIKTMGDAIMAGFCTAAAAVRAGLEIHERIAALGLDLRVGIHAGPAIVVNALGRLDYFGQVVNVAARLQSLAEPGTLCLSASLHAAPHVAALLEQRGVTTRPQQVAIRGLPDEISVYRVRGGRHAGDG